MKILLDFLPLLLFFGTFKFADANKEWAAALASNHLGFLVSGGVVGTEEAPVLLATLVVIVATVIQVAVLKLTRRKVHLMLWITLVLVVVLGGATVWFHNAEFIKWKPTIAYWAMAIALLASQLGFNKNLLKEMIGAEVHLPPAVWQRLNITWVAFFVVMGLINLYVAYNYSMSAWATFKAFGTTGLMFVFMIAQVVYLSRHMKDVPEASASGVPEKLS